MAHKIADTCVGCGACAAQCPVNAIAEADGVFVIDSELCIDCGACEDGCPTESISAE